MKIIYGGRQSGRSTRILREAMDNNGIVIAPSEEQARFLRTLATRAPLWASWAWGDLHVISATALKQFRAVPAHTPLYIDNADLPPMPSFLNVIRELPYEVKGISIEYEGEIELERMPFTRRKRPSE